MQAFEIVYSPEEDRVALGWPGGKLSVHEVLADGSPGPELHEVLRHKATIVQLAWIGDRLVSTSEDGDWAVSDAASGALVHSGSVAGEYAQGSLSPSGKQLFLFSYVGSDAKAFRVDCARGEQVEGPEVDDHLGVQARVFALSDSRALYHFIDTSWKSGRTQEGFVDVDFAGGQVRVRSFERGPANDFDSETRLMAVEPMRGIGVRPDYQPVELLPDGERTWVVLRVEIFDLDSFEVRARPVALRVDAAQLRHTETALATEESGSEAFVEAQDWFVRWLCSAAFVRESEQLWLGMQQGIVRRIDLDKGQAEALLLHGGVPGGASVTLNDVFARNLLNNHTLGVSPSGRYVGFSNPNEFFSVEDHDLSVPQLIRLPPRAAGGPTTEAPGRIDFAGGRLVVLGRAQRMFLASATSGEPERTVLFPRHYGDATRVVASPDGKHLAIAVSGGEPFLYDIEADELMGLGIPPHTIHAAFTGATRLYMVHDAGAVVAVDLGLQDMSAYRRDDEGYPEEMLEDMDEEERRHLQALAAFEQRWSSYAGATWTEGEYDWVGVIDENDELGRYRVARDSLEIEAVDSISVRGRRLAAGDGWIAVADGTRLRWIDTEKARVIVIRRFEGDIRLLHAGRQSGALYVFDDRSGRLLRLPPLGEGDDELVFAYQGPSVAQLALCEATGRLALVNAAGEIELRELQGGALLATLKVTPTEDDERQLVVEQG